MNNFNPIQIITRIATGAISTYAQGASNRPAQNAQNMQGINFAQSFVSNSANQAPVFTASSFPVLSPESQMRLTTIEIEQKANYVKELLNLPKDFASLMDSISSNGPYNSNNQMLDQQLSLLLNGGKINLSMLNSLLSGNSKEAVQKLLMLIADLSKQGATNVSGLKELMNLLAINSNAMSDIQALKNVLILYLPWLPLSVRNEKDLDFQIDIFDKIQGPDPNSETITETLKVLIETINFGNVSSVLQMNEAAQIEVYISAVKDFPEKKAYELLNADAKNSNIVPNILIETKNKLNDSGNTSADSKNTNNVQITSTNMVSPKLMLMAHSLIKIIIELDYQTSVIKQREDSVPDDDK